MSSEVMHMVSEQRSRYMSAIKSKIGNHLFDEVVNIKVAELRKKLTAIGVEPEQHDAYLSSVATPKESEWVVLRRKAESD